MAALKQRRRSFRVMALALIPLPGRSDLAASNHASRLAGGYQLKPFTVVRMGKTCWTFKLVYMPPKDVQDGITFTYTWQLAIDRRRR
jgi:hypothetical protein